MSQKRTKVNGTSHHTSMADATTSNADTNDGANRSLPTNFRTMPLLNALSGLCIVGQAARYYFEHGASSGQQGPKRVVTRILENTDKQSVIQRLKEEIKKKITLNRYAGK